MRIVRVMLAVVIAFALTGCITLEVHVNLLPDGSGTYGFSINIVSDELAMLLAQRGQQDINEMFIEYMENNSSAGEMDDLVSDLPEGIELIDFGFYLTDEGLRVNVFYSFDSLETWNAYAGDQGYIQLSMNESAPAANGEITWSVNLKTDSPDLLEEMQDNPEFNQQLEENGGELKMQLFMRGPRPSPATNYADPYENVELSRLDDGAVVFTGPLTLLAKGNFTARFVGAPLSAEELAAKRREMIPEPSPQFAKILEILKKLREKRELQRAVAQATVDSRFELHVDLVDTEKMMLTAVRTYYGESAQYLAERDLLLLNLLPDLKNNYAIEVKSVTGPDGRAGVEVRRTTRNPIPLYSLEDNVRLRRDNDHWVYRFRLVYWLQQGNPVLSITPEPQLGRLIVHSARPIVGSNGKRLDGNTVQLDVSAGMLAADSSFIVRTQAE